jgi:hypothetical protein
LIRGAERGEIWRAKFLVEAGTGVDDVCGRSAIETPLWAAVVTDYPDVVAYLLEHSANPNVHGALGHTPLNVAAMRGWPPLAMILLAHEADPHLEEKAGRTAVDWAELKGHAEIQSLLRADRASEHQINAVPVERDQQRATSTTVLRETGIKVVHRLDKPRPRGARAPNRYRVQG